MLPFRKLLSRTKPSVQPDSVGGGDEPIQSTGSASDRKSKLPTLEEFLEKRDFTGALALLEFQRASGKAASDVGLWIAYCAFHLGNYKRALNEYQRELKNDAPKTVCTFAACCMFYLGMYHEADVMAQKGENNQLQNRLLFHLSHKFSDEKRLMTHHQQLQDIIEDQLSLASIHYLRSHYQEAIDVYKRLLLDNRDFLALNVYVALCYYKLDYYDVSQEVVALYLQHYPDSATAINLKACNHFRLYNGKAAENELKNLQEISSPSFTFAQDLIKHNLVVFRGGEGALQVLPPVLDIIPEARLNLVIYYLRQDELKEAFNLMKTLEPSIPYEYILKAVVSAAVGQAQGSVRSLYYLLYFALLLRRICGVDCYYKSKITSQREHLKVAQQYFQLVGSSASECDTIPGRQCMASCFFLLKQFDDVLLYLNSIKNYFNNDDTFNFNFAQAKAATGNFKEAEEVFLAIQNDRIKSDYVYQSWLTRCLIMNKKPGQAWELFEKIQETSASPETVFNLLQLIANDCYKMGQFLYAARAFDALEGTDNSQEIWEGKSGACIGVLQQVVAANESREALQEVFQLLKKSNQPQVEQISKVMRMWAKDNKIML